MWVRLSRTVFTKSSKTTMQFTVEHWGPTYLRRPNKQELNAIMERNKERGIPGFMGSLYCCYWEWHQFPTGMVGAYQRRRGKCGMVVKAVCDEHLWDGTCLSARLGF